MDEIKETGGARIGMANASWPFAKLIVNRDRLQLNAGIIGNLVFKPSDIESIEIDSSFLGSGIKINHTVKNYNANVVFQPMGSSTKLITRIEQTGFLNNKDILSEESNSEIESAQSIGGFPLKIPAIIVIVLIWNALMLNDFMKAFNKTTKGIPFGIGSKLALAFMFLVCLFLVISESFGRLILKPGRSVDDIRPFVYFLMFITGVLFLGLTVILH